MARAILSPCSFSLPFLLLSPMDAGEYSLLLETQSSLGSLCNFSRLPPPSLTAPVLSPPQLLNIHTTPRPGPSCLWLHKLPTYQPYPGPPHPLLHPGPPAYHHPPFLPPRSALCTHLATLGEPQLHGPFPWSPSLPHLVWLPCFKIRYLCSVSL